LITQVIECTVKYQSMRTYACCRRVDALGYCSVYRTVRTDVPTQLLLLLPICNYVCM
jgi:hypothetical protein